MVRYNLDNMLKQTNVILRILLRFNYVLKIETYLGTLKI